ncbi:MAG TPA: hypothetical protein VFE47_07075 [Tepidisphaeraceae bacterium]|jgi:hypothetical protein|nr:hypothetical protein [Tepidisphaeraceae bacterium]
MLKQIGIFVGILLVGAAFSYGQAAAPKAAASGAVVTAAAAQKAPTTWLLHLPGIAGPKWIDEQMVLGLRDAGYAGALDVYDWTGTNPGIGALLAYKRNHEQAQKVADMIVEHIRKQPNQHVILTGHSGGTGIAVWALEKLPADVKVDEVILLASALSPDYDLSRALSHVKGKLYSFCSENDVIVLGTGTKMLGTIDGKKTEAAGQSGFCFPPGADLAQYAKLIQKPYDKSYMQYNNLGDHIGCMLRGFSQYVIAPLVVPGAAVVVKPEVDAHVTPAADSHQQHAARS